MANSNRFVALRFSKALFIHRRCTAAAPPFSAAAALNRLHVDTREAAESEKAKELRAGMVGEGAMTNTTEEVAYDATKGATEKVKDTVIAEANENVVDTSEYRSMEDIDDHKL